MKPALHAAFRDRVAARDALLVSLVVAAAVAIALRYADVI